MIRASHCTTIPKKKAMATETNMAIMTESALSVLMRFPNPRSSLLCTLMRAKANVPPNNSNTIETVVEVGIPIELNTSSKTTSVSITASNMHMISAK